MRIIQEELTLHFAKYAKAYQVSSTEFAPEHLCFAVLQIQTLLRLLDFALPAGRGKVEWPVLSMGMKEREEIQKRVYKVVEREVFGERVADT